MAAGGTVATYGTDFTARAEYRPIRRPQPWALSQAPAQPGDTLAATTYDGRRKVLYVQTVFYEERPKVWVVTARVLASDGDTCRLYYRGRRQIPHFTVRGAVAKSNSGRLKEMAA